MFNLIPDEMKQYPQWVVWRYTERNGKQTKPLFNANTGALASVTDPTSWTTFDAACAVAGRYDGIGFVLTEQDPYTFIDLDDPQDDPHLLEQHKKIVEAFTSYAEWSPSGKGAHIIVRGRITEGRRKSQNKIEVYSSERYMTVTGDTRGLPVWPIAERQEQLDFLYAHISKNDKKALTQVLERAEGFTDKHIYEQASRAVNADLFINLWNGNFSQYVREDGLRKYPSQSEADQALVNIIGFYSRNRTQISRLFLQSSLGQRDKPKTHKSYLPSMIEKSFDNVVPDIPVDHDALRASLQHNIHTRQHATEPGAVSYVHDGHVETVPPLVPVAPTVEPAEPSLVSPYVPPPGLVGEIAQYIYCSSPRPVAEISLAGALAFMAGVCGRQFNTPTHTGLNLYLLLLAQTGTGKEGAQSGIDRLFSAVRQSVPAADTFQGPGEIASGAALRKAIAKKPCVVSVIGEVGLRMERMAAPNAPAAEKTLQATLLDLYNKSGVGQSLKASVYSDTDKNVADTQSPSFTLFGESVPERLYSAIDEAMIASGLLPRFSIVEYIGPRPAMQTVNPVVPDDLRQSCADLCELVLTLQHKNQVCTVAEDTEAANILAAFDRHADLQINTTEHDAVRQLWNRAHVKALKLASLVAVGVNPFLPTIDAAAAQWACRFVEYEVKLFLGKFERGEIGRSDTDETRQLQEVRRVLLDFATKPYAEISKYMNGSPQTMHNALVVPMSYLQRRLSNVSCMRKDRRGAKTAIKNAMDVLIENGAVRKYDAVRAGNEFQTSATVFQLVSPELLRE